MEFYRHEYPESYCVVVFKNSKTGKIGITHNCSYEKTIRDYWEKNEKNHTILEVKQIENLKAFQFFKYWEKIPKAFNTQTQREYKFDFYKYVCGADLSEKYRGLERSEND